jgi:hypothetical protein
VQDLKTPFGNYEAFSLLIGQIRDAKPGRIPRIERARGGRPRKPAPQQPFHLPAIEHKERSARATLRNIFEANLGDFSKNAADH